MSKILESYILEVVQNYYEPGIPDARKGHGYATFNQKMDPRPIAADGWPYDLYDRGDNDEEIFDDLETQQQFMSKMALDRVADDPSGARDPFHFVDGSTRGLSDHVENMTLKDVFLESPLIRLKSRSSESDGVVNQFGIRVPGGTQFGWSSAYPFRDEESEKPVFSLKDLMTKNEDQLDRYPGEVSKREEWQEEWSSSSGNDQDLEP